MQNLNTFTLLGRITEPKRFADGKALGFSLANRQDYKNEDGERVERTMWFSLTVWGKMADHLEAFLEKGDQIIATGRLESVKKDDGTTSYFFSVQQVELVSRPKDDKNDKKSAPTKQKVKPASNWNKNKKPVVDDDDDEDFDDDDE